MHIRDTALDLWVFLPTYLYVHIFKYILSGLKHLHNALMMCIHHYIVVSASVYPPICGVVVIASVVWPNSFVHSTLHAQGDFANVTPAAL